MEKKPGRSPLNAQIYEEACEWFLAFRMGEPEPAARSAFDNWMRRSPEHVAAYLEVAAVWSNPAAYDGRAKWDADTLIAQARTEPDNIVPLTDDRTLSASKAPGSPASVEPTARSRTAWFALAASFLLCALGAGTWYSIRGDVYETAAGEQRSIRLDDGSMIDLNSKTTIAVHYDAHGRNVEIEAGQALFKVVHDTTRPFIVDSGDTRVRAVGTQFDVYRKPSGTVVTVIEGRVAVSTSNATALFVAADEQMTLAPNKAPQIAKGTASTAIAWTGRKIVFSRASLTEVAEEFNRYSARRLIIEDPDAYGFHVSGAFSSSDIESIVRFLRTRPGVEVEESRSEIRIRKKTT